jgi:hypothetical protein
MEMPAQPIDDAGPLGDQVVAVVDQQPDLPGGTVQPGHRQLRFPQRRPRHRQRVDRIGLAIGAAGGTGVGHELGRDPHDLLAGAEQVALEPARQVPAVLDRPAPLRAEARCPDQQVEVVGGRRLDRALTELAATLVDDDHGVGLLVCVDPQDHHGRVSFHQYGDGDQDRTGRWACLNGGGATLLSSHADRSAPVLRAAQRELATRAPSTGANPQHRAA